MYILCSPLDVKSMFYLGMAWEAAKGGEECLHAEEGWNHH